MTKNDTPQLVVTPASQWKKATEIHLLPSGKVVELKRVSPISLIMRAGNVPDGLAQIAFDAMNSGGKKVTKAVTYKKEDLALMADLMDTITKAVLVKPAIVDNPDYDNFQITIDDVDEKDKMWLMSWALDAGGEAQAAHRFPDEPSGNVPVAQTS